jgi:arylsulfatase A-like enzyme
MAEKLPNILLLMTDQQRYDSLGCYGFEGANTPNLDRLAEQGVLFVQNYVTNTICTPSRASMLTGKHLPGHGVHRLYDDLPDDEILAGKHLQQLGYRTALFGKLHVSSLDREANFRHPNDGFDVYQWCVEGCARMESPYHAYAKWLKNKDPQFHQSMVRLSRGIGHIPEQYHMSHWAADQTIDFINSHDDTKPFFAMMSIFDPHDPYADYPKEAASLIDESLIPDPLICDNEFEGKPADLLREHKGSYLGSFDNFSLDELRQMRFGYHVSIAYADRQFGRVLDALDKKGLTENTLVIFTSDHGDMLGDHQLLVKGAFFYDPVTRVPLILRWPKKLQAGRCVNSLVQNLDIAATVLSAAGMDSESIKKYMPEACDLLPLATGKVPFVREDAVCCYRNSGISAENTQGIYFDPPINAVMIRHGKYKLNIWHNPDPAEKEFQGELYDMEKDPQEMNNLWNDPDCLEVRRQLTERLLNWSCQQELRQRPRSDETLPKVKMKNALK